MEVLLLKEFIKYFIFIQLIGQCCCNNMCDLKLSDLGWQDNWNVYIKAVGPERYELVRSSYVPVDKQIFGRCNNEKPPHSFTCNNKLRLAKHPPEPTPCKRKQGLKPVLKEFKVNYCPYKLFKIGFDYKIHNDLHFLEAYQVCFDLKHMRPSFTINMAYPKAGRRPNYIKLRFDEILDKKLGTALNHDKIFEKIIELLGPHQSYTKKTDTQNFIAPAYLTPMADFAIPNLKSLTYYILNVIPQIQSIGRGNWNRIEEWARHPSHTPSKVCTGVLDCKLDSHNIKDLDCVLQLKNDEGQLVPIFLADHRKIPVPLWMYKVVKNHKKALVFLTLNNIYHEGKIEVPRRICKETECPSGLANHFTKINLGRTFCCEYEHFIETNVPHLRAVC